MTQENHIIIDIKDLNIVPKSLINTMTEIINIDRGKVIIVLTINKNVLNLEAIHRAALVIQVNNSKDPNW